MAKIAYIKKRFNKRTMGLIEQADGIIEEYREAGYDLTLRQLYYQFVARGFIPNQDIEYKKLGNAISDARLAGLLDWDAIEDRTRHLRALSHWDSPADIVESCARQFRVDTRATQKHCVEVWIEKDALIGVVESVCERLDVPCFSCRGYVSQSAMWRAAMRIKKEERRRITRILHLGDHDPSGIDMTRDIRDRLDMFGCSVDVDRIALTMEQVEEIQPPPNPAKITDSRSAAYIAEYGDESWELDALDPAYLERLIEDHVRELTDIDARVECLEKQDTGRERLARIAENLHEEE
jgi:hypothetical protein